MRRPFSVLVFCFFVSASLMAQDKSLVNTTASPHAQLHSVNMGDVAWTEGFWADRFQVCRDTMIPHLWEIYSDPNVAHAFRNFEIAAGLAQGEHEGPPFHDGDFYKLFEAMANTYALTKDEKLDALMDRIIPVIAASQRADGYIHTPVIIEQKKQEAGQTEFQDRLNFETYNLGHLMTAACVHYRATGKTALLDVARKATDYLYDFYQRASDELARNAICPSHYMGVVEMYRTTHDAKYLELAQRLIDIRGMVGEGVGTDHNQDRVPFRQQTKAMGHAVRANYLYAGVADVYAETGEDSLMHALDAIWDDLMQHKMYITGACGALYDGVSPQGTSYQPSEIQQVHQAYGREYQLPNLTAHNETCANIGNVLWNWRMLQVTGEARFADVLELSLYNSVLSGVSLDGQRFFYTNPLRVSQDLPYELRWAGQRQEYIALSNCCPPNAVRTVAEVSNYLYSVSDQGVWVNLYGGNRLDTKLADGTRLKLTQTTEYPWDGNIRLTLEQTPKKNLSFFLRIPGWSQGATLQINGEPQQVPLTAGTYAEVNRKWKKGDVIELRLPMEAKLVEANPLVEETRNQVAVKRGPIVYCLESTDLPQGEKMANVALPVGMKFQPKRMQIDGSAVMSLEGQAELLEEPTWQNQLYREVTPRQPKPASVRLIPYYAWGNRGQSDMSVWLPLSR